MMIDGDSNCDGGDKMIDHNDSLYYNNIDSNLALSIYLAISEFHDPYKDRFFFKILIYQTLHVIPGLFLSLGCSGVVPAIHLLISMGFIQGVEQGALGYLVLMGALYIIGALMYAFRVPERFFPGKCNFWVSN